MTKKIAPIEAEVETEEIIFSAKDLANELGIDAKSFRRWLRAQTTDRANKGGRWNFTAETKADYLAAYRKDEVIEDEDEAELDD